MHGLLWCLFPCIVQNHKKIFLLLLHCQNHKARKSAFYACHVDWQDPCRLLGDNKRKGPGLVASD